MNPESAKVPFFTYIRRVKGLKIALLILFTHLLDISTIGINFLFKHEVFVKFEVNSLLKEAWIGGNLFSQIILELLVLGVVVVVWRKSHYFVRSFGTILIGGFSVAIATNILSGFFISPANSYFNLICLGFGWAVCLILFIQGLGAKLNRSVLVTSLLATIGGGLYGPGLVPGIVFFISLILLCAFLKIDLRKNK